MEQGVGIEHCTGCGRPADEGDHAPCRRRQAASDPPRYCPHCGRKLRVQVLPTSWTAECVRCGDVGLTRAVRAAERLG